MPSQFRRYRRDVARRKNGLDLIEGFSIYRIKFRNDLIRLFYDGELVFSDGYDIASAEKNVRSLAYGICQKSDLYLYHNRNDHRPAARLVVEELADLVAQERFHVIGIHFAEVRDLLE
jgi:hypothetical protein